MGKRMEGSPSQVILRHLGFSPREGGERSAGRTFAVKPLLTDKQAKPYQ